MSAAVSIKTAPVVFVPDTSEAAKKARECAAEAMALGDLKLANAYSVNAELLVEVGRLRALTAEVADELESTFDTEYLSPLRRIIARLRGHR